MVTLIVKILRRW